MNIKNFYDYKEHCWIMMKDSEKLMILNKWRYPIKKKWKKESLEGWTSLAQLQKNFMVMSMEIFITITLLNIILKSWHNWMSHTPAKMLCFRILSIQHTEEVIVKILRTTQRWRTDRQFLEYCVKKDDYTKSNLSDRIS